MNVASPDLSQELYELSNWCPSERCNGIHYATSPPSYDLGYVLRKLPPGSRVFRATNGSWAAVRSSHAKATWTETPEDAAAKLAIELFKQGILTKEATT